MGTFRFAHSCNCCSDFDGIRSRKKKFLRRLVSSTSSIFPISSDSNFLARKPKGKEKKRIKITTNNRLGSITASLAVFQLHHSDDSGMALNRRNLNLKDNLNKAPHSILTLRSALGTLEWV